MSIKFESWTKERFEQVMERLVALEAALYELKTTVNVTAPRNVPEDETSQWLARRFRKKEHTDPTN